MKEVEIQKCPECGTTNWISIESLSGVLFRQCGDCGLMQRTKATYEWENIGIRPIKES